MAVAIVAFTGGLDSTWCLYDILRKDKFAEVIILQANVGGPATQYLAETFARRGIVKQLKELFPNKNIHESVCPIPAIFPNQYGDHQPQLVQQLNIYMALLRTAIKIKADGTSIACVTGWHNEDVFENDPTEGTLQAYLDQYKNILGGMFNSINLCSSNRIALTTPAWNKTKLDMWVELPRQIRQHITVADGYDLEWNDTDNVINIKPTRVIKQYEYDDIGIVVNKNPRQYPLESLSNMDLWGIHAGRNIGYFTAYIGESPYMTYLYALINERLGNATKPMEGSGTSTAGYSCMYSKELDSWLHVSRYTDTTKIKDKYDDLFYGNDSDDTTNVVSIQSSEGCTGNINVSPTDVGEASVVSDDVSEQTHGRVPSS